jgi:hypothetical protein
VTSYLYRTVVPPATPWQRAFRLGCGKACFQGTSREFAADASSVEVPSFDFPTGTVNEKQARRVLPARREASVSLARLPRPVGNLPHQSKGNSK